MAGCSGPGVPDADFSLGDEEFLKKHPSYLSSSARTGRAGTSAPVAIYTPEPVYTAEARAAKLSGTVTISLVVDTQGLPRDLQVMKPLGQGLDQAALNAVSRYRFKPAHDATGAPVAVHLNVSVVFQIH
jgi:TonB family protein